MQMRHSILYLLAHGIPAFVAFLTLAVYTRWISPEAYGIYSTLLIVANSANIILFNWLYVALLRYWNDTDFKQAELISLLLIVLAIGSMVILLGAVSYFAFTADALMTAALASLMISNALYMAYQRINSASLQAERYLKIELIRVIVTALLAVCLVWLGYSWYGILLATTVGFLVPLCFRHFWQGFCVYPIQLNPTKAITLLHYGLPLSLSFILLEIIHATDRVLLSWLIGFEAAGQYAVAFSLPFQLLILIGSAINAAFYPLILQTLEQQGETAAKKKLSDYLLILLGLLLPSYFGLMAVSRDFMPLLIGEAYLAESLRLLPIIGLLLVLNAVYLFHTSLAFQLAKQTYKPILVVGLAAILNVVLNLILIPHYRIEGAIIASLVAYLICIVYGNFLGAKFFKLPVLWLEVTKLIAAASLMLIILNQLAIGDGLVEGLVRVLVGVLVYSSAIYLLNVGNSKYYVLSFLKSMNKPHESTHYSA
ncbi:lipopolysaccharide biosynthesis protein [uncultured Thiothrix sp.]|uniref:lipopolysaccharide biosynthesis protein n=1 Tax=uncultured Thiothrix sp. TaxID=223185 RepID=UPI002630946E|nr:oligosaccharide flippase family protein [uncultured Thiothrix sp.]